MTPNRGILRGRVWYQETPWYTLVIVSAVWFAGGPALFAQLHCKVQQVNAIGPPPEGCLFGHLKNVIVFPSLGTVVFLSLYNISNGSTEGGRSLPSMLAGGDLDGDIYAVMQYDPLLSVITWTPAE